MRLSARGEMERRFDLLKRRLRGSNQSRGLGAAFFIEKGGGRFGKRFPMETVRFYALRWPANVVASFKTDFCGEVGGVSVDLVFRIAAIGLIVSLLAQVLNKAGREEIATLMTLSGVVIVLLMVADLIGSFFSSMRSIFLIY